MSKFYDPKAFQHLGYKTHTVAFSVKEGQTRYNLPDADFFRHKTIVGAMVRRPKDGISHFSKNGIALASAAVLASAYLTLTQNNKGYVNDEPLDNYVLDTYVTGPGQFRQLWLDNGFDPSNSYVRLTMPPANVPNDQELEIVFYYFDPEDC